jgi:hypothetical protein
MTKSIDPFEEFLRKKKVEMLEQQYREHKDRAPDATAKAAEVRTQVEENDDPEQEAKLLEEMDDFFQSGQCAGAKLFNEAKNEARTLSDDKVEEIKDALDDVFETEAATPQKDEKDTTFVSFFRQVQDKFPGERPRPGEVPSFPKEATREDDEEAPLDPSDIEAAAYEVSSDAPPAAEDDDAPPNAEGRLTVAEILLKGSQTTPEQRLEALCRLVSRLVERSNLPESEIIEAMIRSGVEF